MSNLDIKKFLYAWLGKQQKKPEYEFSQTNFKTGPRFKAEVFYFLKKDFQNKQLKCLYFFQVRVIGFDFVGCGNSTSKKDAQTNCAQDFCQYLVRNGFLKQTDLPTVEVK